MLLRLLDVAGARLGEVKEMIQRRLEEESNWDEEESEEGRCPATFCLENSRLRAQEIF